MHELDRIEIRALGEAPPTSRAGRGRHLMARAVSKAPSHCACLGELRAVRDLLCVAA
jgi:hypothetical protein